MRRLMYGLRLWCYFAVHGEPGIDPCYPFGWYMRIHDKRQENFRWCRGEAPRWTPASVRRFSQ